MKNKTVSFLLLIALLMTVACTAPNAAQTPASSVPTGMITEQTKCGKCSDGDTTHTAEFRDLMLRNGYIDAKGAVVRVYNLGNSTFYNITPPYLRENSDIELFSNENGHAFLRIDDVLYRFDSLGGHHFNLCLWDYDGDGTKDLVNYRNWGSGFSYLSVLVLDLNTKKEINVYSELARRKPETTYDCIAPTYDYTDPAKSFDFSFDFDGEHIYINGEIVTYQNGVFCHGEAGEPLEATVTAP